MTFAPAQPVPAPQARGARYGLFSVANGPIDLDQRAIGGGVTWQPDTCGTAHYWPTLCHEERSGYTVKTFDEEPDIATAASFIAYGSATCGSVGTGVEGMAAKATRNLLSGEQTVAEEALAAALAAVATPVVPADAADIVSVISELEQWLYGTATMAYGNAGYLHASPRIAAWADSQGLLIQDWIPGGGIRWRTRMGTFWSIGGGYPDDGAITITGQVTVWRSPDVVQTPAQLDRDTNQWYALAEREYAVGWDCHAGSADFDWIPPS